MKFASVSDAVVYLNRVGYKTLIANAGLNHVRIMRNEHGDLAIVRPIHREAEVYEDDGYWQEKLEDWAMDASY